MSFHKFLIFLRKFGYSTEVTKDLTIKSDKDYSNEILEKIFKNQNDQKEEINKIAYDPNLIISNFLNNE